MLLQLLTACVLRSSPFATPRCWTPCLTVKQLRGILPRGVTGTLNTPQQQLQQQQHCDTPVQQEPEHQLQLQQQQRRQQSLADKNRSFSGALRQLQGLGQLLQLLESPQWGPCLCDLDAVSVVGALAVLVRSSDWQQLQQQQQRGGTQKQQREWQELRQRGEHAMQVGGGNACFALRCLVLLCTLCSRYIVVWGGPPCVVLLAIAPSAWPSECAVAR